MPYSIEAAVVEGVSVTVIPVDVSVSVCSVGVVSEPPEEPAEVIDDAVGKTVVSTLPVRVSPAGAARSVPLHVE